jgi:hypothetical protein
MKVTAVSNDKQEAKVVYRDGPLFRVLRGTVTEEGEFVVVRRQDGEYRIPKHAVERIELKGGK